MMRYLLLAILAWVLYNLVFKLIIPVYRTTRQVRRKFREMREESQESGVGNQPQSHSKKPEFKPGKEDYLDFEEVKGEDRSR
jgi:hypothetical protein